MDKQTGPKGFLVVLPGEIIEIPQDSDKSWLTLFYSLPRELAEKWKPAYELPRCPYEVLRTDKYDHIVCDDMFKLLVWDCYAWCAWQFFQVKDRKGNYCLHYSRLSFKMLCKNGNSISVIQWVWDYPQNIKTERFGSQPERSVFPVWVLTGFACHSTRKSEGRCPP